jgi:hypothetical protein
MFSVLFEVNPKAASGTPITTTPGCCASNWSRSTASSPAVAFAEHADFGPRSLRPGQKAALPGSVVFGCSAG